MLVLSRKRNEEIIIGDVITISVVEVRGDKVRLGIEAPREVSIHRSEVYDAIKAGNQDTYVSHLENGRIDDAYEMLFNNLAEVREGDLEILSQGISISDKANADRDYFDKKAIATSIGDMQTEFKNYNIN